MVRPQNGGPAAARNTILDEARGTFVAFFDDDDEALPDRISEQIRVLTDYERQAGAELVACYAGGERIYANGYVKPLPAIGSQPIVPHGEKLADYLLFFGRQPGWFYGSGTPTAALLARRSTFGAVGGFDADLRRVEDADFAIRLALKGGISSVPQKVCSSSTRPRRPTNPPNATAMRKSLWRKNSSTISIP